MKTWLKKQLEFSKKLAVSIQVIFCVAMVVSYALPAIYDHMDATCISIFNTVATLTGSVLLAYFGKAGFENYKKIRFDLDFEKGTNDTGINSDVEKNGGGVE